VTPTSAHPRAVPPARRVTKRRDETPRPPEDTTPPQCGHCHTPLPPPAPTGRPARFCSPACRTRAWRAASHSHDTPTHDADNDLSLTPAATTRTCTVHPGCVLVRCARLLCGWPVHLRDQPGRPRRFCSPACRAAAYRLLH
jgi:hypothetical protein